MIGCDSEGAILYWSPAARSAYGFTAEEALGARAPALLHTRFPAPLFEIVEELADLGRWRGRLVHRTRDGRSVTVESRWVARSDAGGRWAGWVAIERSVPAGGAAAGASSETTAASPAAPAASPETQSDPSAAATPAGLVVHDLNNALAIIVNYTGFVAEELDRPQADPTDAGRAAMRRDVGEIQAAAERALSLIRELADPSPRPAAPPER